MKIVLDITQKDYGIEGEKLMARKDIRSGVVYADYETGEVKAEEQRYTIEIEKNKEFAMFFGEKIGDYLRLNNQQKNVLALLSLNMELSTNIVFITAPRRIEWANRIGISLQAFNNALKRLMDSQIIKKQGNGQYMINPAIYSKSNFADRLRSKEVFLMKIMFKVNTKDGCVASDAGVETEVLEVDNG